jgi:hypothetical protein
LAVPGSTLGLLWPLMRLSWHQPLGLLGVLLIGGVSASVLASLLTGRLLPRVGPGPVVAAGSAAIAVALTGQAGNAALPAGLGLVVGTLTASALGPALLLLSLLLAALYRGLTRQNSGTAGDAKP